MNRYRGRFNLAVLALSTLLVTAVGGLAPQSTRGQTPAISGTDLLKSVPFDRITLIDGTVLQVEPVSPRPLPEYDPRKDRGKKAVTAGRQPNIFIPSQKAEIAAAELQKQEEAAQVDEITIKPIGDEGVYRVRRGSIKQIEYFEDMLLASGEQLIRAKDFSRAFEHYLLVKERAGNWNGLDEHVDQLLYQEGTAALQDNQVERGLRLLTELHARRQDFPGLLDQLAKAYEGRVDRLLKMEAYADGRRVLRELETLAPDHLIVRELKGRFVDRARSFLERAAAEDGAGKLDDVVAALRVWPEVEGGAERYQSAFEALPTLEVGVADLAASIGPWIHTPAEARVSRLLYLPMLAAEDEEALQGQRDDQLAASVTTANLGRGIKLTLRPGPAWSDGSGPVSAVDVMRSLTERARPDALNYQARWAQILERIEVTDSQTVAIELSRTPLKAGDWFLDPVGPAHAGRDGRIPGPGKSRTLVGSGSFTLRSDSDGNVVLLRRDGPEDSSGSTPRIRRVVERPIPDGAVAVAGLLRGDITLLEHVAPHQVAELTQHEDVKVGRYAEPRMHLLALDGRNPILRNRAFRRGLAYAIDRATILEEDILGRKADDRNRATSSAFPQESYAKAPDVRPLAHDALMARMLIAAAQKELDEPVIRLTFQYPDLPAVQAGVGKIIEALTAAGIEARAIARPESELENELRSGQRFDIAYRVATCREPITEAGPLLCPGYDAPPGRDALAAIASPRIHQLLLQLESATEFPTARGLVIQIDREVRDELPIIPLWQIDDHYAWRSRLRGPAEVADNLYENFDSWEIEPWFARDPW